jgi:hypothetical protein
MKTPLEGPFAIVLSIPTTVKVAEIAPWIHHSWVKPASLEWECIPNLVSPCRITLWDLKALLQQVFTSQETTGDQEWHEDSPGLVTPGNWLIYAWLNLEESTLQRDKKTVFHTSDFTARHCHSLSVSAAVVLTRLCHKFGKNCPCWLDLLALFYLFWAGCIITVYCFWYGLPSWSQEPSSCDLCMHTTWVGNVVTRTLLFHIYYSCAGTVIGSYTHNHATCASMVITISASTPPTTLRSNG